MTPSAQAATTAGNAPVHPLVIFDDVGHTPGLTLAPLDDLRPTFAIRTGAVITAERLAHALHRPISALIARPGHDALNAELFPTLALSLASLPAHALATAADLTLVNGRVALPGRELTHLKPDQALIDANGSLLAARCHGRHAHALLTAPLPADAARALGLATLNGADSLVLTKPWHVRTHRDACLASDLDALTKRPSALLPPGVIRTGDFPLILSPTARLSPGCVINTEAGTVVIDDHAVVKPLAVITGPAYIGPHTNILEHANIRPHSAIGPMCKVAGETGGCLWQGYSNKAHHGYLGDCFVGQWVNLGAGTTNSNLLNTYASVRMPTLPHGLPEPTGLQFLGCLIGDHVKTAINTTIMTGSVLGTGTMWASSKPVKGFVPPMTWLADDSTPTPYQLDKFLEVMHAVMARRSMTPGPAMIDAVRRLTLHQDRLP